jgi:hypothetical protein
MNPEGYPEAPFDPLFARAPEEAPPPPRLGVALGEAVGIWHQRWGSLAAIFAITWVPLGLVDAYLTHEVFDAEEIARPLGFFYALEALLGTLGSAAVLTLGAGELAGRPVSFWGAISGGLRRWLFLLVARSIAIFGVFVACLALLLPGLWLGARLVFVDCAAVLGRSGFVNPLGTSFDLSRGRFWPCFAMGVAGYCLAYAPAVVLFVAQEFAPSLNVWWLTGAAACSASMFGVMVMLVILAYYRAARRHRGDKSV